MSASNGSNPLGGRGIAAGPARLPRLTGNWGDSRVLDEVRGWDLVDGFRHNEQAGLYSRWDYRQLAFPRNQGLRIDLVLLSRPLCMCSPTTTLLLLPW